MMMTSRQAYWRLSLIVLIYGVLGLAHSWWHPLQHPADELAHFQYSRFIAQHGRLPLNEQEREQAGYLSFWPPVYHALVAALGGWSSNSEQRSNIRIISASEISNSEDERWPLRGDVLLWYIGRLTSVVLSAATIGLTFLTTRQLVSHNYWLAVVSAFIIAALPGFVFISAAMSYEALVGVLGVLYLLLLIRLVKDGGRWWQFAALGLLMGVSVTVKYTSVILPVEVVLVFAYLAWRGGWGWWSWLKNTAVVGVSSLVAASWWFAFLIIKFNEIDEYGPLVGALKPIIAGGIDTSQNYTAALLTGGQIGSFEPGYIKPDPFSDWLWQMYQSIWVANIGEYPLGLPAFVFIGFFCVLAVVSLVLAWRRIPAHRMWIGLLLLHMALFFAFPLLRFAIQGNVAWTAQGRHVLFPLAAVIPLLLVYGWDAWLPARVQRWLAVVLVGGLLCWNMAQLIRAGTFYKPPIPVRTSSYAAGTIQHPLSVKAGPQDHLRLIGYNAQVVSVQSALRLELFWRGQVNVTKNYLRRVALTQANQTTLDWVTYPTNGRYNTFRWEKNEIIRDEIWLPLAGLPADTYQIEIQLLDGDTPLPIAGQDRLRLTEINLPDTPALKPDLPLSVTVDGREVVSGISLWRPPRARGTNLPEYDAGTTLAFEWQGQPAEEERVEWWLVDPNGVAYPTRLARSNWRYQVINGALPPFSQTVKVGWPSGNYRLRAEVWRNDEQLAVAESEPLLTVTNHRPHLFEPLPIAQPLEANFDNKIKLLGFDLPQRVLSPGQWLPLTLLWQGVQPMAQSYTVFAKLLTEDQRQVWGSTDRFPADGYPTWAWWPGEMVLDGFEIPVNPSIPPGIYWVNVGYYLPQNNTTVPLPLVQNGQVSQVNSVTFGPVRVGNPLKANLSVNVGSPNTALSVKFGEPSVIELRGYTLTPADDALHLTLYWESVAPTPINWSIFAHLRNEAGETVIQKDGPAGSSSGISYWTSIWEPGELITDTLAIPLSPDLPAGNYTLVVGLYNLADGSRLAVPNSPNRELILETRTLP